MEMFGFYIQWNNNVSQVLQMCEKSLDGPLFLFKNNPVVTRGKQIFDKIYDKYKEEEDEKRWISIKAI